MSKAIPVLKAVQQFLSFCAARNDSPHTLRAYNGDLLQFVRFVGHETPTDAIRRKDVRGYLAHLCSGLKRTSVTRKIAVVRAFSAWAFQEDYSEVNAAEGISGPRRHHKMPDVPSEADMTILLGGRIDSACPERDRVILELLYGCGLRVAELIGVNIEDFQERTLLVRGKGRKERLAPFGRYVQEALNRWLPIRERRLAKMGATTNALLFSIGPHRSVERLDVRSVGRILKDVAVSKHLPAYHPHQLRHACATHMHDHGASIQAVSAMLGHQKLSTTQIYTRVSSGRMMKTYSLAHPHARVA